MPDFSFEDECKGIVCGTDEVGRGPLAGPVVAAAVIIPHELRKLDFIPDIGDSKKLTPKKRDYLYEKIINNFPYAIVEITPQEIDEINILQASLKAMKISCEQLPKIDHALIDGNKAPALSCQVTTIIKGDSKSITIAAASIIAKVHRDRIMAALHEKFPDYGWKNNAGYPTKEHRDAIITHGITLHHRRSFAPVRNAINSIKSPI